MEERKFTTIGAHAISCNNPCSKEFSKPVEGNVKGFEGSDVTMRCVVKGAAFRGQHYGSTDEHLPKLEACRVCTIYTTTPSEANPT